MQPIVDTHQHIWDLNQFNLSWLDSEPTLNRSFVMKDYVAAVKEMNVRKAVYMEVDVHLSTGNGGRISNRCVSIEGHRDGRRCNFRTPRITGLRELH